MRGIVRERTTTACLAKLKRWAGHSCQKKPFQALHGWVAGCEALAGLVDREDAVLLAGEFDGAHDVQRVDQRITATVYVFFCQVGPGLGEQQINFPAGQFRAEVFAGNAQRVMGLLHTSKERQRVGLLDVNAGQISFDKAAIRLQVSFARDLSCFVEIGQALLLEIAAGSGEIALRLTGHLVALASQLIARQVGVGQGRERVLQGCLIFVASDQHASTPEQRGSNEFSISETESDGYRLILPALFANSARSVTTRRVDGLRKS